MKVYSTPIDGLLLFRSEIYKDERGSFQETFRDYILENEVGMGTRFVQENQSISHQNVFRGFHFQYGIFAQAKLVRVVKGAVIDIVIDLRKDSPTYGQLHSQFLSPEDNLQLFIPVGFAHGFVSLEDNTIFQYKCTQYYNKEHEGGINPSSFLKEKYKINDRDLAFPHFDNYLEFYGDKINF